MGIPMEVGIYFSIISFFVLILMGMLLFIDPDSNKSIFALILSFINAVISAVAALSFMAMDIYGFDATGTIVSNVTADMFPLGVIFWAFTYFSVIFGIYAVSLLFKKPWKGAFEVKTVPWYLE